MDIGLSALRVNSELKKTGLFHLAKLYFNCNVLKPRQVQMSNWEKDVLNEEQVRYAAYDALMGRHVYDHLVTQGTYCTVTYRTGL